MIVSFFLIVAYYNYSGICSMDFKKWFDQQRLECTDDHWDNSSWGKNNSMSCLSKMGLRPRGFKPIE